MRRNGQPSRPSAMTCCRFSSLKTLLTSMEGTPPSLSMSCPISIGRFSGVPHWPVLGVPRRNPSYSLANSGYAGVLSNMGRHEEAIAQARRARRYDDSIRACQKAVELDPNDAGPLWWMALSHEQEHELSKGYCGIGEGSESSRRGNSLARAVGQRLCAGRGDRQSIKRPQPAEGTLQETIRLSGGHRHRRIQQLPEPIFDNYVPIHGSGVCCNVLTLQNRMDIQRSY